MGSCATGLIVLATILGPVTLVFLAVSFGTDNWLVYTVKRDKLSAAERSDSQSNVALAKYTHTRQRGLFRECYPGNDTLFLDKADDKVDGYCFNIKYELPQNEESSSDFTARLHLLRSFLAFYIIALVFFVAAYIFGLVLCCWRISRWAYIAGLCAYIAAFSTAAAIAFFHGAEYIERNKIENKNEFYKSWSSTIKEATTRTYGWSYALGWVGMILAAFTATFYSLAGCYITSDRYEDSREIMEKRGHYGRDYPMVVGEPVYAVEEPYYGQKGYYGYPRGGYVGPYVYERPVLERSIAPSTYGPHESWQWREVSS
ncbi:hypothetical protein LOTGIDRAFT_229513 [Lottia gigantea]|uniref:Uncharacterized protein n=1 Tax=Lottia gigantea TaxID=225164 RepID=V3ZIA4_LOTGI|nr:hypothetical protein LOTGIDRAFT_229513 [Lottia gigantea]ESO83932.1 hypothetical protein LOTGIDRAFT_229513 [Lottia gigantea]